MTPEQLHVIEETLPQIKAQADVFAARFYEECFVLWPEARSQVQGNLSERGRALVDEFIALSTSVHDMDAFVARAHALGVQHRSHGAHRLHYDQVETALMVALAAALDSRWDEPTAQAWHRLYRLMAETMLEGSAGIAFAPKR